MSKHNANGEEILDPTPVALPIRFKRPTPLNERIKQMVAQEMSLAAQAAGEESFNEADDFNIPDDPIDPSTPYEENFDPHVPFIGARAAEMAHGLVPDEIDSKIEAGVKEVERLRKQQASKKPKPKAEPREPKEPIEEPELEFGDNQ